MSNLMTDLGENYEYLNTIVKNNIELKKIQLIEESSKIIGYAILIFCCALLFLVLIACLVIIGIVWLSAVLGSIIYAAMSISVFILGIIIILYIFRKTIFYNPISNKFAQIIE